MNRYFYYWNILLGFPKSLYINLYYFGWLGFKLPIYTVFRTRLTNVKGKIITKSKVRRGMIRIGFTGVALSTYKQWNTWNINGTMIFEGCANFGIGSKLFVGQNGILTIGDNFLVTSNAEIICNHSLTFGKNILLSWDILIMDTDSHPVRDRGLNIINPDKPIILENNIWIGARSIILKGTYVAANSVIAAGSIINKVFDTPNVIIAGSPARIVKKEISWLYEQL